MNTTTTKQLTKKQIAYAESMCSDKHGSTCAVCEKSWCVWYLNTVAIARTFCKCETAPAGVNAFNVLPYAQQIAE